MARRGDDERGVDRVGVHAALVVVVHGHKGPVGHDSRDADLAVFGIARRASDQVLDGSGVEKLDVREGEDFGEERRREECGVLDDDVVALIFEGDAEGGEEGVCGFAHDHSGEELAAEPCAAAYWVSVRSKMTCNGGRIY